MQSDVTEAMRVRTLHVVSVFQFCKPFQGHNLLPVVSHVMQRWLAAVDFFIS